MERSLLLLKRMWETLLRWLLLLLNTVPLKWLLKRLQERLLLY